MFLGIACHAVAKAVTGYFYGRAVSKEPIIEAVDLFYQFRSMGRAIASGHECCVLLGFVATEYQQIAYAQKLEVYEHIFQILSVVSAANNMRHHRNIILFLYGSGNRNGAGTTAYPLTLHQSILQLMIDVFTAMGGDVDIFGAEFLQTVYGAEQGCRSVSFQRRQHFKRKSRSAAIGYDVCYVHFLSDLAILYTTKHFAPRVWRTVFPCAVR